MSYAADRIEDKIREVSNAIASGDELDQEDWNKGYKAGLESALSALYRDLHR